MVPYGRAEAGPSWRRPPLDLAVMVAAIGNAAAFAPTLSTPTSTRARSSARS
ncbi:MAG: hypothetical protein MZV64_34605 [Ignavibacteriales bacterium]|nr:hypothetical protein [Ignavibacteriales bacterium]